LIDKIEVPTHKQWPLVSGSDCPQLVQEAFLEVRIDWAIDGGEPPYLVRSLHHHDGDGH
jgi:hypothetical protein